MTHVPTVIISRTAAALAGLGRRMEVPSKLGSVSLIKPLGEGGMSVVHLGRHEILQKDVAVKFLLDIPASTDDPRFTAFLEGAKAASAIKHPGLNVIYHADAVQGVPYLVMELIEGPTIADLLRQHGPMPLNIARAVVESVCGAVGELHDHGIIHRDIKPANIMIDPTGRVVVTDFGLAMQRPAALFGGSAGGVAGTPCYMAPEMFEANVSSRTDVYAIGVTLFEVLTGKAPYAGDFQELCFAHRTTQMPVGPLAEYGVPESIIVLIERTMHKETLFRPKSARHVLDAFTKACDAAGINCAPDTQLQRYIEIGRGGAESVGSVSTTPTPAYYERLNTLAEVKRRTPDGTISEAPAFSVSPTAVADLVPANAPAAAPAPAAPSAPSVKPPLVAGLSRLPSRIDPRVATAIFAVLGTLAMILLFQFSIWVYQQTVMIFQRGSPSMPDSAVELAAMKGRLPFPIRLVPDIAQAAIVIAGPLFFTWWPYLRFVLSRPPRDGVTRCGWCRYTLDNVRDLRCPECGRLFVTRRADGEKPMALRWSTRFKYYAVAAAAFLGVLAVWGMPYFQLLKLAMGAPPPFDFSIGGFAVLFGFVAPATAASLVALYFFARRTACLTGRTYCGKCGADLAGATKAECPACAQHL